MTATQVQERLATVNITDVTSCNGNVVEAMRDENGEIQTVAFTRFISAYRRGDFRVGEPERTELMQMENVALEMAHDEGASIPSWGQVARALIQVISSDQ